MTEVSVLVVCQLVKRDGQTHISRFRGQGYDLYRVGIADSMGGVDVFLFHGQQITIMFFFIQSLLIPFSARRLVMAFFNCFSRCDAPDFLLVLFFMGVVFDGNPVRQLFVCHYAIQPTGMVKPVNGLRQQRRFLVDQSEIQQDIMA